MVNAVSVLLILASAHFIDDGWMSQTGGMKSFSKSHPSIRMVSEDLKISFTDEEAAKVDVLFVFRNEGKATKITMGFPETYQRKFGSSMTGFRTWVDGVRTPIHKSIYAPAEHADGEPGDDEITAIRSKSVKFAANQTVKVRVSYSASTSGDTSGNRSFIYTLTSGASWKGPIGTCKITVTWPKLTDYCPPYPWPFSDRWKYTVPHMATLTVTNWKPKENLNLSMLPGFRNVWLNGKRLDPGSGAESFQYSMNGDPADPMIRSDALYKLPGKGVSLSQGVVTFDGGKKVRLPRGYKVIHSQTDASVLADTFEFVRLKDLVEAQGGSYHYDPKFDRIDLTLKK